MTSISFKAKLWLYPGESGNWHFITVPKKETQSIDARFKKHKRGWGSLPVSVRIGKTTWKTSIFPDGKTQTYLLPIKASVRRSEGLMEGDSVSVTLRVDLS